MDYQDFFWLGVKLGAVKAALVTAVRYIRILKRKN